MSQRFERVLLVGGGHSHVEVLRRFALRPDPAVALTLISPEPDTPYSGMLPGLVAGHYTRAESHIALGPLARWARTRFVVGRVVALDLDALTLTLASGEREAFDVVSLDIGSAPDLALPGAREHALAVKPVESFLASWETMRNELAAGSVPTIAVVGGGAGGVEVLLAMQYRLRDSTRQGAPRFALVTDQAELLPQHAPGVRRRLQRVLSARDVAVHRGSGVVAVEPGALRLASGRSLTADCFVWATSAAAQPWLAGSGLACDPKGFVSVDRHLRSTSHPFVFAAGDCATQIAYPRPKSGVFAVRQGPPLAANLRRTVHDEPLAAYVPQRRALALISTGGKHAIATRGRWTLAGDWVWRWKDRIDRRFVARYVPPSSGGSPVPAPLSRRT